MASNETVPNGDVADLTVYDFNHPQHRLGEPFAQLTVTGKKIAEEITNGVDNVLHVLGEAKLVSAEYVKRQDYISSLENENCIFKSELSPLSVDSLIVIEKRLIHSMVESFFGGSAAKAVEEPKDEKKEKSENEEGEKEDETAEAEEPEEPVVARELSSTEQRLANRLRLCITSAMRKVWGNCFSIAQESDLIFSVEDITTVSSEQSVVALLKYSVTTNGVESSFTVVLPWRAVETVREKLSKDKPANTIDNANWCTSLKDHVEACYVDLQGQLAESEVTVEQLLNMQSGDFIPLGDLGTATFMIDNTPIFEAAIGTSEGQVSASILRWIDQRES